MADANTNDRRLGTGRNHFRSFDHDWAFVGFAGGWTKAATALAATARACIATFFTFLPSFIFILVGGRDNIRLTAPLSAISAAVVGVIVSLALFFSEHIFNLAKPISQWDFITMTITVVACVALFRFKTGTITLIVSCEFSGLVVSYLR